MDAHTDELIADLLTLDKENPVKPPRETEYQFECRCLRYELFSSAEYGIRLTRHTLH